MRQRRKPILPKKIRPKTVRVWCYCWAKIFSAGRRWHSITTISTSYVNIQNLSKQFGIRTYFYPSVVHRFLGSGYFSVSYPSNVGSRRGGIFSTFHDCYHTVARVWFSIILYASFYTRLGSPINLLAYDRSTTTDTAFFHRRIYVPVQWGAVRYMAIRAYFFRRLSRIQIALIIYSIVSRA